MSVHGQGRVVRRVFAELGRGSVAFSAPGGPATANPNYDLSPVFAFPENIPATAKGFIITAARIVQPTATDWTISLMVSGSAVQTLAHIASAGAYNAWVVESDSFFESVPVGTLYSDITIRWQSNNANNLTLTDIAAYIVYGYGA